MLTALKNTKFLIASSGIFLLFLFPFLTEARTVVRSGDTVSIGQDQVIEGDFYSAGNIITVSGKVDEDLLLAGAEINVNGQVGADALVVGGNIDVNGTIGDDLRVVGGTIVITQPVLGDVFVIGGEVKITDTASVTGDVTVIGGNAVINGPVDGRVLGWMDKLRIDSTVLGEVDVTVTSLTLGDNASIGGDITYVSNTQLTRSQSATVEGETYRNDPVVEGGEFDMAAMLMPLLIILFSVALWYLLARRTLEKVVNQALVPGVRPVLIGSMVLILTPFAFSVLMVSMLGLFAGIAVMATYILFLTLAVVALPAVLAQFMQGLFKDKNDLSLLSLLIGTLLVGICLVVPVIGPILLIGFTIITFGAMVDMLIKANQ